jgi:aspartate kinase
MALIVQKYGGTSLADAARIRRVAERVVATREAGHDVVAVVSAMGHHTDDLVELAQRVSPNPPPRELDMLLTAGERISMSLLAMAIADLGTTAKSFTGSQAGIITDTLHGKARILDVRAGRITEALAAGHAVIVAGFQGVSTEHDVTTLGRGGSDTTAVALAAALGAASCEIYTDVDGVYTADPRIVPEARKLHAVSYEEMLEMAASGAKVLQLRSVEYARNHGVRIHCRSSADETPGTLVVSEQETMERPLVTAVTHSTDEARVTLTGVPDRPGVAGRIFGALADANINVDMIIQNEPVSHHQGADLSFTVEADDLAGAVEAIQGQDSSIGIETDEAMGKVSIVGAGMRSHPGVAAKVFRVLGENEINIEMISTSPIKVSCVIRADQVPQAVRALHTAFELGEGAIRKEEPTGKEHRPTVSS